MGNLRPPVRHPPSAPHRLTGCAVGLLAPRDSFAQKPEAGVRPAESQRWHGSSSPRKEEDREDIRQWTTDNNLFALVEYPGVPLTKARFTVGQELRSVR
ncbi:hypothetical protein NDU88_001530 [Pleurodeles waltl]|uniref:Uncharacterized protein n=1 Tax=Pleurodeles waltl TaxID=8319 RepID=A0AAV7LB92_PLEWA|nr:hypothetical protein NDU88_001530 [Pleurodeles waltl]